MTDERGEQQKKRREELKSAELKHAELIEQRNKFNAEARLYADERNELHETRKKLVETSNGVKKQRDDYVAQMREHKKERNDLQTRAKQLIAMQRERKKGMFSKLPLKLKETQADLQILEYQQETRAMTLRNENDLIEKIRKKQIEHASLQKELDKQNLLSDDMSAEEQNISELFKKADEAHEKVTEFYQRSQEAHEKYIKNMSEISNLIKQADKKHKEFLDARERANGYHEKSRELLGRILEIKKEQRMNYEAERNLLQSINSDAKNAFNENKIAEKGDENLDKLLKSGRITL